MDAFVIYDYNGLSSAPAHGLFTSRRSALAFEAESVTSFFLWRPATFFYSKITNSVARGR